MSAATWRADVVIGSWATTIYEDAAADDAAGPVVLAGLAASWDSDADAWPSQPDPTTLRMALLVRKAAAVVPTINQGDEMAVTIKSSDWANDGTPAFFEFWGRVTDVDAQPLNDGLRFDLVAVDHLADPAEVTIGAPPFPASQVWWDRWADIAAAAGSQGITLLTPPNVPQNGYGGTPDPVGGTGYPVQLATRDADSTPLAELIEECLGSVAAWQQQGLSVSLPGESHQVGPWQRWNRPIVVAQQDNEAGTIMRSLVVDYIGQGTYPDIAGLPYQLVADGAGNVSLQLRADAPPTTPTSSAAWLPAYAIDRDSVTWRQDKASSPNRVAVTGPSTATVQLDEAVAARGPVETRIDAHCDGGAFATALAVMHLGDAYDATPRYTLDEVTIRPQLITEGGAWWPRLFPSAVNGDHSAGRFLLVTGIPDAWNLYHRPDFPGRLRGAELRIDRGGRLLLTARVVHQVPNVNGPNGQLRAEQLPSATFGDPTPAQFGDLTAVDLRLVDGDL